ncbi:hypothetical protein PAPYR_4151 [Paratrimastix pyriformis]|uniref:Uncharacterized protein n=1 Tax=Paratrimastix pyriformis TaxID=342808 RepID=A0ABQ8ULP5_9EUKA|nr:hypothetical protein PAPYR_4151 [Paratrimastix pyriformis]
MLSSLRSEATSQSDRANKLSSVVQELQLQCSLVQAQVRNEIQRRLFAENLHHEQHLLIEHLKQSADILRGEVARLSSRLPDHVVSSSPQPPDVRTNIGNSRHSLQ